MPTRDQLVNALRQADANGDQQAATRFAEMIKNNQFDQQQSMLSRAGDLAGTVAKEFVGDFQAKQAIGASVVAEPVAGVAGLLTAGANKLGLTDATGAEAVEAVKSGAEKLSSIGRTKRAEEILAGIGKTLSPVGEGIQATENYLGDNVYQATGSPAAAAAAKTLPTAALELLGIAKPIKAASKARPPKGLERVSKGEVDTAIVETAPEIADLKTASRDIYKELDEIQAVLKPSEARKIRDGIGNIVTKAGGQLTDEAKRIAGSIKEMLSPRIKTTLTRGAEAVSNVSPSKLDEARQAATDMTSSSDAATRRVGMQIRDEIDSFMDDIGESSFSGGNVKDVGKRYNAARKLWGRAKRAETIEEIFNNADIKGAGDVVKNIKSGFQRIITNKKVARFFPKDELDAMKEFVRNQNAGSLEKLVGKFGVTNGSLINPAAGQALLEFIAPSSGFITRLGAIATGNIAKAKGARSAENAAQLLRRTQNAGPDARKITEAYLKTTPKAKRLPEELADLYVSGGAKIDELLRSLDKLTREAAEIAKARSNLIAGAAAPVVAQEVSNGQ